MTKLIKFTDPAQIFLSGVIFSNGHYWKELRRFMLRNLRDFGFGKSSMEELFHEEIAKLCQRLAKYEGQPTDLVSFFLLTSFSVQFVLVEHWENVVTSLDCNR